MNDRYAKMELEKDAKFVRRCVGEHRARVTYEPGRHQYRHLYLDSCAGIRRNIMRICKKRGLTVRQMIDIADRSDVVANV